MRAIRTPSLVAKEAGAKTIVITNFGRSPIQRHADVVLSTLVRGKLLGFEGMTGRVAQFAVIDAVTASLALRREDGRPQVA